MNRLQHSIKLSRPTVVVAVLLVVTLVGILSTIALARRNSQNWTVMSSPAPGSSSGLFGIVAVSSDNIWAVGSYQKDTNPSQTLIEHWNGLNWSVVPSPSPGSASNTLDSIAAASANDIWAVGSFQNSSGPAQTLIEHWNGSKWSIIPSPSPGSASNTLNGIATVSRKAAWAVGDFQSGAAPSQALVEYWNGSTWSISSSPSPGTAGNALKGIVALSKSDAWAVGDSQSGPDSFQTLIEHWDGLNWMAASGVMLPDTNANLLNAVAASSANDVWAVGTSYTPSTVGPRTLIEHWNGTTWSIASSPTPGTLNSTLSSAFAVSANQVWAVGYSIDIDTRIPHILLESWDGASWNVSAGPNISGSSGDMLSGVASLPDGKTWGVGEDEITVAIGRTLIASCC